MALNLKTRYLVLNSKNAPQDPAKHGITVASRQGKGSPSILNRADAEAFALKLLEKNPGERYYLFQGIAAIAMESVPASTKATVKPTGTAVGSMLR